jgi:GNAT superfamily N-acetyltransferase
MNIVMFIQENPLLRDAYGILSSVVKIVPFYIFQEFLSDEKELNLRPDLGSLQASVLEPSDIKAVSLNPEVPESEGLLLDRLAHGSICLGLKHNDDIAAYTWCNLKEFQYHPTLDITLKEDEAYLYDARTFKAYRGKNIAPYLRYQLYKYLAKTGRTKLYSYTVLFNTAAVNFKLKLKAKPIKLYLGFVFFKRYRLNILVKDYESK